MREKKYSGNFYNNDNKEDMDENCPSCMYKNKKVEKNKKECPNCYYIPNKENQEESKNK
ncbi:hypothetical protein [Clostridium cadaveris]|uniref:hypothetical protein n=1 Tax=Clostridium cadaveris TaxID=1529 RepID=UPI001E41CB2F|nr:hypothetical protein [Clostridium cadaveris]UFH65642.1 hypothetical protein KQH81_03645 [Clostridium cadaveris]